MKWQSNINYGDLKWFLPKLSCFNGAQAHNFLNSYTFWQHFKCSDFDSLPSPCQQEDFKSIIFTRTFSVASLPVLVSESDTKKEDFQYPVVQHRWCPPGLRYGSLQLIIFRLNENNDTEDDRLAFFLKDLKILCRKVFSNSKNNI